MKYILILFLSLAVSACATKQKKQEEKQFSIEYTQSDTDFDPYLALFKLEAEKNGVNIGEYPSGLQVKLAKGLFYAYGAEGICSFKGDKIMIDIDSKAWEARGHMGREELMFHELGHCILGLGHNDETTADGGHLHLMHSYGVTENEYAYNREYYLKDMFGTYLAIIRRQQQMLMNIFTEPNPDEELQEELNNPNL